MNYEAVAQKAVLTGVDERHVFAVRKLTNGFTVVTHGWIGTYFPDIPAVLAHIARCLGGEDAVPVMPVSPEEAGLFDPAQTPLPLDFSQEDAAIENAVTDARSAFMRMYPGAARWDCTLHIDRMFQEHGFADYHDYTIKRNDVMPELKHRLLARLSADPILAGTTATDTPEGKEENHD